MSRSPLALCVGAGPEQVVAIEAARDLGIRVVALDGNATAPGLRLADRGVVLNISDEAGVIEEARRVGPGFLVPVPIGRLLTTVGAVNDALGLRGITRAAAVNCTDKNRFHRLLEEAGLPRPRQVLAGSLAEIRAAASSLGYPVVLKPRHGAGKAGVLVVREPAALEESVREHAQAKTAGDDTILEEFVAGPELGVDGVIIDGRMTITMIREKLVTPLPYRQELQYAAPAALPAEIAGEVESCVRRAAEALGLNDCLVNADVILRDGIVPVLVEIAGRPGGLHISSIILESSGVHVLKEFMRMQMGETWSFAPRHSRPVVFSFLRMEAGRLAARPSDEAVRSLPGVLSFETSLEAGAVVEPIACCRDVLRRGYVLTTGANKAEAAARAEEVLSLFRVETSSAPVENRSAGGEAMNVQNLDVDVANRSAATRALREHHLLYPDERIVCFLAANYPDRTENRLRHALDVGFGSGRHCVLLRDFGFDVSGVDYVESAVTTAREIYGEQLKDARLLQADLRDRPFADGTFDVILCWGVAFLRPLAEMEADLRILSAILKTGGRLLVNFRGRDNWFFARGRQLDGAGNTYLLDDGAGPYRSMCYTFLDHAEASALLDRAGFAIENSERIDLWKKNAAERHSWWVFWAKKP